MADTKSKPKYVKAGGKPGNTTQAQPLERVVVDETKPVMKTPTRVSMPPPEFPPAPTV